MNILPCCNQYDTPLIARRFHRSGNQDPLLAAVQAARTCLEHARLDIEEVGALLVTSEAPPVLAGLAAALHHRLELRPNAVALEVGGACTGFLAALWTARTLLPRVGVVLVICVEAPSQFLELRPGSAGEAAALFGDGQPWLGVLAGGVGETFARPAGSGDLDSGRCWADLGRGDHRVVCPHQESSSLSRHGIKTATGMVSVWRAAVRALDRS